MNQNREEMLDRAIDAVRDDAPDAEDMRLAADRVWQRLAAGLPQTAVAAAGTSAEQPIEGCEGYRALLPAYLAGELSPARRLLLEDHTRECIGCRRALIAARSGEVEHPAAAPAAERRPSRSRLWLPLAAAVLVALGLAGWFLSDGLFYRGPVATVASMDGELMTIGSGGVALLAPGRSIVAGETVRTAKGSRAVVTLEDGSEVEMDERTQLRVRERRRGRTIYVDRGAVIVEAADQRPKHLYVVTDESRVSVTGTVFAVEHGVKGSRVAVIEGEVHVDQGGRELVLHPGDQSTSRASLAKVSLAEQISWSQKVDQYLALLHEVNELRAELARRVGPGEVRYASELAPLAPADTFAYIALPNVSESLAESYQVFRERLATSPALADWWGQHAGAEGERHLDETIARLRDFGSYLGDEVVLALPRSADAGGGFEPGGPVVLAEVARPDAFRAYLAAEIGRIAAEHPEAGGHLVLVGDPSAIAAGDDAFYLWVGDGHFVAAVDPERLRQAIAALAAGGSGFADTPLGDAVRAAYADGTQWLFAADLAGAMAAEGDADEELAASGLGDVRQLVVERWDEGERAVMSAELSFGHSRRGIASWLASPAPMGALDFVSPDAHAVAAFVVKEPSRMLDDLMSIAGEDDAELAEVEEQLGLSLREDLAAPLGGEIALALDGPLLPEPSWKAVLEVYDPARLQHTLETAVTRVADQRAREGEGAGPTLTAETSGGRTFYQLATAGGGGFHYLYVDGYLLAAPSRALLLRTLDQRAAGAVLTASAKFRSLWPRDARTDVSALFYQNLGAVLSPLAGGLSRLAGGELSEEQRQTLAELLEDSEPTLAYAYGEEARILIAGTGPGGPFGLGFQALSGLSGMATLGQLLNAAVEETAAQQTAEGDV